MRTLLILLAAASFCAVATDGLAQTRSRERQQGPTEEDRQAQRDRRALDREMQNQDLPLPELANTGPCPYVKVLYDAARQIDFVGDRKASSAVAYSGELQGLTATCRYKDKEPIVVDINVTFAVGKGPQATADSKQFGYWVAVTDRNLSVLAKEQFDFTASFPPGADRVLVFERLSNIVIPRANERVSGENFEILVGFNVTAEMAEFNRQGTRFVVNATGQQSAGTTASQ